MIVGFRRAQGDLEDAWMTCFLSVVAFGVAVEIVYISTAVMSTLYIYWKKYILLWESSMH